MRKIINIVSAFVLSFASFFLPAVNSLPTHAAVGDPINATATIDAASLAYMDDSRFSFDGRNIDTFIQTADGNKRINFSLVKGIYKFHSNCHIFCCGKLARLKSVCVQHTFDRLNMA